MKRTTTTAQAMPRALQMELVAAQESGDQRAIRQAMVRHPELREAITRFVLTLQVVDAPPAAAADDLDAIIDRGILRGMRRLNLARTIEAVGLSKVQVAQRLHLGTDVIMQLVQGRVMVTSIPQTLFARLATVLNATIEEIRQAVQGSFEERLTPALLRSKGGVPDTTQSFADAIRQSPSMSAADRAEWLEAEYEA